MYQAGTNLIIGEHEARFHGKNMVTPSLYIPESYWNRRVLHVDANYFYAQVETLYNPGLRGQPMAVVGDEEERSGIVLTATPQAKLRGVKTAMVYWEAERLCPGITFVRADYAKYRYICNELRRIFLRYTDQVEPFGMDEAWLDVTGSQGLFGTATQIAKRIAGDIRRELSMTISCGVSHNKTEAKLGSDLHKPNAITVLHGGNWKRTTFALHVGDMMMIGRRTVPKMHALGIKTIGQLAATPVYLLEENFGKMGLYYWMIANGLDQSPVAVYGTSYTPENETIGNSQTAPYDLATEEEVRCQLIPIAESVAARVRKAGYAAWGVAVYLRDFELHSRTRQLKLSQPTCLARDILEASMALYRKHQWGKPLRAVGTRAIYLTDAATPYQVDFTRDAQKQEELVRLERKKDEIRTRNGNKSVVWAREMVHPELSGLDIETQNVVRPEGYMHST